MNYTRFNWRGLALAAAGLLSLTSAPVHAQNAEAEEVPVFITIGQSNADGSAMFDADEDSRLLSWYSSDSNNGRLKIWYRSAQVQNQTSNALGEAARWVVDGAVTDVEPGWLNLWYRNENTDGRTAMNIIHGYGTYSTGSDTNCAQGRRGMEGEFGMKFAEAFPDQDLYIIKLGASGSFISSWANPADNTNWNYFYENMFKPAIADLLARGKRPRLAGIWWMQGCADRSRDQAYYEKWLRTLVNKCRTDLGFADGKFYIGHILAPGENADYPAGSVQYGEGVRAAQDNVAADTEGVEILDTRDCSLQYESSFGGYLHFDHPGINLIGDKLAAKVIADGKEGWATYSTPGSWSTAGVFTPAIGSPEITYSTEGNVVTATLTYPGWTETKSYTLGEATSNSPGYLDMDGSRYVTIPHDAQFDIAAGESRTISAKVWLDTYGAHRGIVCNRFNASTVNNQGTTGFDIYGGNSASQSMSNNVNLNKGVWNNLGHVWCNTLTTGRWAHVCWVLDGTAGTSKMYLDGELKHTVTNADICNYPINPQCDILIGVRYTTAQTGSTVDKSSCWRGKIDDVRFFSKAMTQAEVLADIDAEVDASTADLIAAYDFTDLTGTNCPDISGNGHNAVLVNFPDYSATGSLLTIENSDPNAGTITVSDSNGALNNGSRVPDGTVLTVEATPAADYSLQSILVNGSAISGTTFTMNGPTTVSAVFVRDAAAPTKVLVFDMNEDGSRYYRIPAIVTAADGSLVALADKRGSSLSDLPNTISIVSKRSTDGGETWSSAVTVAQGNAATGKTYGDPAVVLDRTTGNLVAVFAGDTGFFTSTKTARAGFYVSISEDNGQTWSDPRAITDQVYQDSWYGAFCASGSMLQTKSGRIMFVSNTRLSSAQWVTDVYEFVCASDDGGQTWTVLNPDARIPAEGNGNESKLAELSDGTLIMSIRSSGKRRFSKSTDGGVTWTPATQVNDLMEPDCNGDILVYPSTDGQNRMLHSLPANGSVRRDVSISLSYDEGATWPVRKKLVDNYSAYSSLTVLPDGSIGCFVEEGKWDSNISGEDGFRLYFMKFTLDWLTDGQDIAEPDPVFDGTLNCDGSRYMYIDHAPEFDIEAGASMTVTAKVWLAEYGEHRGIVSNRWHDGTANRNTTGFDIYGGNSAAMSMSNNVNLYKGSWNNLGHVWCNTLRAENWHYVTWVLDGTAGTSKMYLDGELKHTVTNADIRNYPINPQGDMLVGARYDVSDGRATSVNTNWLWKGKIDDVRFYSRALSQDEVTAEMTRTVDASTPDLIAAYDFAEIKGLTVTDISGNGHDGTLVGFPENAPGYAVTIGDYDQSRGSVEVYNGTTKVLNGRKVEAGTELTVEAIPLEGFIVSKVLVNDVDLKADSEGAYKFAIDADVTVTAEFEHDPDAPLAYCIPSYVYTSTHRHVKKFTLSDETGASVEVDGVTPVNGQSVYVDRTGTALTTTAGSTLSFATTSASGEWMHSYLYIDFGRDGDFDVDKTVIAPNGDLVAFDRYAGTAGTYYDDKGTRYSDGHTYLTQTKLSFTLPDGMQPGTYRVRYKLDWNDVDPCGNATMSSNAGAMVDFTLVIEGEYLDAPRTVTVVSDNEELGSVAIVNPETDGTSATTDLKAVTVKAVPAEGAAFINWTDADGSILSTDAEFVFRGETDATLTAHFGYTVTYSSSSFGSLDVSAAGKTVNSGDVVAPGTLIRIKASAENGCRLVSIQVNGMVVEDGSEIQVNSAIDIRAEFSDATGDLIINIEGEGTVAVGTDFDDITDTIGGTLYVSGSPLREGTGLYILLTPAANYMLGSAIIEGTLDGNITYPGDEFYPSAVTDGVYWTYAEAAASDMTVSVTFAPMGSGINGIETDSADAVYYNLQGIRVSRQNLLPGIYLRSQGGKTAKVFIGK